MRRQGTYTKKVGKVRQAKRSARRGWRWWRTASWRKRILVIGGPIFAFLVLTPLVTYAVFAHDIDDKERLMNRNNTGIVITDTNGKTIYSFGRAKHRDIVELTNIADPMKKALIASEDKDFYKHGGISLRGVLGALYGNFVSGGANYGGSTLTQQLAKNTVLSNERTFLRKYQELSVAIAIEQKYSKDDILDMYLNSVYYGEGAFGIQDASETYFGKEPKDLDLAQSAMLVGVLPAPSAYSPISGDPSLAKQRQTTVLTRMVNTGAITEDQKQAALAEQLTYANVAGQTATNEAPAFVEMVLNQLYTQYGEEKVTRSGYQVQTGFDLDLQKNMEQNVANNLNFITANGGSNASGVAIDPATGEIRALVGSVDYNNAQFGKVNMVTTPRQPGSSFKPIYYSEALAKGVIYPSKIYVDEPTDFGNNYKPENASKTYAGNISVRNALDRSLNIPSVKVMQDLGIDNAVAAAKRVGITSLTGNNYGLSLALGSAEVNLEQMTNAYAAFANQGVQHDNILVTKIKNKYDDTIYTVSRKNNQVISKEGAYLISDILSDQTARQPVFGSSLSVSGYKAAVKTGTTNDNRDAWAIGYTPQIAIGIWVGNNDNSVMQNGGSLMAGPIWRGTMRYYLSTNKVTSTEFTRPSSIVSRPVCYSNGLIASREGNGTYNEIFLATALPTGSCDVPAPETENTSNTSNTSNSSDNTTNTSNTLDNSTNATNSSNSSNSSNNSANNTSNNSSGTIPIPVPTVGN